MRVWFMFALAIVVGMTATAAAQDEIIEGVDKTAEKTSKKKELPPVVQALKKTRFVHGRPNTAAKCYVYLQSASWCGPCCQEMPEIVETYKEMKEAGVEIILCGCDHDKKGVKNYVKKFRIPFPATLADKKLKLPGFIEAKFIPHATFVDPNGKVLVAGQGSIIMNWQKYVPKDKEEGNSDAE